MRIFLFQALIAVFVVTIVAAVIFRSRRAWNIIHFLRKIGWVYVIVMLLVAIIRLWQS